MMERRLTLEVTARLEPRNRLLARLPDAVLSKLRPHLKPVSLPRGRALCEVDEPLRRVYFVEAGAVSLVTVFEDGATAEMATVGREGVLGVDTLLGGEHALGRYVVTLSGFALAVETSRFQSALREAPELHAACEVYAQAFLANLLQNVACNARHTVEQRCARWLLMCDDQVEDDSFDLTQEYLADMLGVRRSTVTLVARALQNTDLIRYRRGAITVRSGKPGERCEQAARATPITMARTPARGGTGGADERQSHQVVSKAGWVRPLHHVRLRQTVRGEPDRPPPVLRSAGGGMQFLHPFR